MSKGSRILIVDDNAQVREVLERLFEDDHDVRTAADGEEGLRLIHRWAPDLVMLDLEMPKMSGLDVLRHIATEHAEIKVIAVSGHAAAEHLGKDAKRLGAAEFFVKPFDLDELAMVVQKTLEDDE